jgi:stearoyl-CoA desaturase (delta-9 desaturase)
VALSVTWNGQRIDWVNVVYFAAIHVLALGALWSFSWTGLLLLIVLNWLGGSIGICLAYHRLLTHMGLAVP